MKEILEAIKEWIIYQFSTDDKYDRGREEIEFLRKLVEEEVHQRTFLMEYIRDLIGRIPGEVSSIPQLEMPEPIVKRKFIPWHVRQQQLEEKDRVKARKINDEANVALNKNKSIEELESEILNGV